MKMKTIPALSLTLIMALNASAYDMVVGTNHFDVVFENASTPSTLQDFIVADVQRCYEAWGTNVEIRASRATTHVMRIYPPVFMGPYYLEDPSVQRRSIYVPKDIVTNSVGQLSLIVPSTLIQKYADGLDFKTNHLVQVQAADAFVDFLSSPEFANVTSNQVSNYILYKDLPPQGYLENGDSFVKDLSDQMYFRPSILGFTYSDRGPDATNLWVFVPVIPRIRTAMSSFDVFPAIWHDGKWKFSFWDATE